MKDLKTNTRITNFFFILLVLNLIPVAFPVKAAGFDLNSDSSVSVSASIPDTYLTVTGYSSADAKVELEGASVYSLTYSDDSGYFQFDNLLMPKNYSELCLTSTDSNYRQSTPVCLPPIPSTKSNSTIGPVLLPPTITLDTDQVDAYSTTYTSGESIPNSTVTIHLYQETNKAPLLVKPVQAFSLPLLTAQTDASGHYSLSLPTTYSSNYRLYASTTFADNLSPKSNTLTYKLASSTSLFTFIFISFISVALFFILFLLFYFIVKKNYVRPVHLHP